MDTLHVLALSAGALGSQIQTFFSQLRAPRWIHKSSVASYTRARQTSSKPPRPLLTGPTGRATLKGRQPPNAAVSKRNSAISADEGNRQRQHFLIASSKPFNNGKATSSKQQLLTINNHTALGCFPGTAKTNQWWLVSSRCPQRPLISTLPTVYWGIFLNKQEEHSTHRPISCFPREAYESSEQYHKRCLRETQQKNTTLIYRKQGQSNLGVLQSAEEAKQPRSHQLILTGAPNNWEAKEISAFLVQQQWTHVDIQASRTQNRQTQWLLIKSSTS